jgi:hypothetical protein
VIPDVSELRPGGTKSVPWWVKPTAIPATSDIEILHEKVEHTNKESHVSYQGTQRFVIGSRPHPLLAALLISPVERELSSSGNPHSTKDRLGELIP